MKSFSHLREFFRDNAWRYVVGIFWLIVVNIISLQFPRLLGEVTDLINMRQIGTADLLRYAGYIVAIAVAMAVGRFMWRIFIMGSARKVEYFLRNKLFAHFETLSANFFTEHKTGDLMAHATNDVRALRMTLGPGVLMLLDSIFMTVVTVYLMANTIDWKLTLLALLPMPFLAGLAGRLGKMIHGRFRAVQQSFSALTDRVQENLSGIRVIKSFVQEEAEIQRFDRAARDYVVKNMQMIKVWGLMGPMIQLISGISYLIVLGYGGIMVISAAITLGELVAFNTYLGMLVWPMMALGRVINVLQRGLLPWSDWVPCFRQARGVRRPRLRRGKRIEGGNRIPQPGFHLSQRHRGAQGHQYPVAAGQDPGHHRPYRQRQDHPGQPVGAPV